MPRTPSPTLGAPLLRSTLFIAAPGNHDVAKPNLTLFPDSLAYFMYWSQPLNGPMNQDGRPEHAGFHQPPIEEKQAFLTATPGTYPQHGELLVRLWQRALDRARFQSERQLEQPRAPRLVDQGSGLRQIGHVAFCRLHHPGFNSAKSHFTDQWMRRLSEIFEAGGVDIVFNGHVHNYQRSFPLRFKPDSGAVTNLAGGEWTLDKKYDGASQDQARRRDLSGHRRGRGARLQSRAAGRSRPPGSRSRTNSSRR